MCTLAALTVVQPWTSIPLMVAPAVLASKSPEMTVRCTPAAGPVLVASGNPPGVGEVGGVVVGGAVVGGVVVGGAVVGVAVAVGLGVDGVNSAMMRRWSLTQSCARVRWLPVECAASSW